MRPDEAPRLLAFLLREIERWLRCERIHGDLSGYNILYRQGRLTVIDVPQAVDARVNPHSYELLRRDIDNVARYFSRYGIACDSDEAASRLWGRYLRADL